MQIGVEKRRGEGSNMASKFDLVNVYIKLLSTSIDSDTLNQSDIKYIVHHIGRDDFEDAKQRCLLRIQENGDDALTWALYGLTLMLQANEKDTGEALQKAAELDPENLLVMNLMGDYLCFAGKDMEGEDFYYGSLSRDEKQIHPRKMLYFQFMSRNEYLQALEVVIPALRTSPDDEEIWTSVKTALAMMGSHDYAEEVAESLTKEFKDHHLAWRCQAHVFLAIKKYTEAESAAKRAIELKKDNGENWNMLGTILSMVGRTTAAVKCQRKAVKFAPKNGMFWTSLGMALLKAGKQEECKQVITRAVRVDPEAASQLLQHMMKG